MYVLSLSVGHFMNLTLEGPCIIFCTIYTFQRDAQLCISLECIYIAKNDTRAFQCQVDVTLFDKFKTFYNNHKPREPNLNRAVDSVDSTITH